MNHRQRPDPALPASSPSWNRPVGNVPFTDGAPVKASELQASFPDLNPPIPGSPN